MQITKKYVNKRNIKYKYIYIYIYKNKSLPITVLILLRKRQQHNGTRRTRRPIVTFEELITYSLIMDTLSPLNAVCEIRGAQLIKMVDW